MSCWELVAMWTSAEEPLMCRQNMYVRATQALHNTNTAAPASEQINSERRGGGGGRKVNEWADFHFFPWKKEILLPHTDQLLAFLRLQFVGPLQSDTSTEPEEHLRCAAARPDPEALCVLAQFPATEVGCCVNCWQLSTLNMFSHCNMFISIHFLWPQQTWNSASESLKYSAFISCFYTKTSSCFQTVWTQCSSLKCFTAEPFRSLWSRIIE